MGRMIPGTGRKETITTFGPDRWSVQIASLGMMTNTFSPGSAGKHSPGATSRGFAGDPGYGVNRWAGETPYHAGPVQPLSAPIVPIADPLSKRLGFGSGVSGQPGMPSTGVHPINSSLALLGMDQFGAAGMGG